MMSAIQVDVDDELARLRHELDHARGADDPPRLGRALRGLADYLAITGVYPEGQALLEEAAALCRAHGDRLGESGVRHDLGQLLESAGEPEAALVQLDAALRLAVEAGSVDAQAVILHDRAVLLADAGREDEALQSFQRAEALCREAEDDGSRYAILIAWARLCTDIEEHAEARERWGEAITLARAYDDTVRLAECLQGLAHTQIEAEDFSAARATLERALPVARENRDLETEVALLLTYAELLLELEDTTAAAHAADDARKRAEEAEMPVGVARAWLVLADLSRDAGELRAAAERYQRAAETFGMLQEIEQLAVAEQRHGSVLAELGDRVAAEGLLRRAASHHEAVGNALGAAMARQALSRLPADS